MKISRRSFLQTASLATAGAALAPRLWSQVPGANSDIRVAMIGLGNRSKDHLASYDALSGVRVVALCDPDSSRLNAVAEARRAKGKPVQTFTDLRLILSRRDVDAVSIATPNHWHSLAAVWACQAGKDVYVEKPISENIWEGRQAVAAAAKYSRVMQAGTQSRSRLDLAAAVAWVRAGHLGKIKVVRGLCYKRRPSIGLTVGPQPVPASVNYDLWLGPAPMAPLRRKHLHYDWHWFWATGAGDLGNQGIHQMDVCRWFLGDPGLAPHTLTAGGRFGYVDDAETPNTVIAWHGYAEAPLVFEVRGLPAQKGSEKMDRYPDAKIGTNVGVVVECEGGVVVASNGSRYDTGAEFGAGMGAVAAYDLKGARVQNFDDQAGTADPQVQHFGNFLEVVRSRRIADLHGQIRNGHVSSSLCHTANLSYRLGAGAEAGAIRERLQGNAPLTEAFGRMSEHLAGQGVDLGQDRARLGLPLTVDPVAETFVGNAAATELRTRHYRAPYVVPSVE